MTIVIKLSYGLRPATDILCDMAHRFQIQSLPHWPFAGTKAVDAPVLEFWREDKTDFALLPHSADSAHDAIHADEPGVGDRYKVTSTGYLIPDYSYGHTKRIERNRELLNQRIKRFFDAADLSQNTDHTGTQINAEIMRCDAALDQINQVRAEKGYKEFSLSMPYREMSDAEKQFVSMGANTVGNVVNRLGRLGNIILQGDSEGIPFEHDEEWVAANMDEVKAEFKKLHQKIADDKHKTLVRCVMNKEDRVDHDGTFHHLIREITKPIMEYIREGVTEETATRVENLTRDNIVLEIGCCLEAIDETHETMQIITAHPVFKAFIQTSAKQGSHALNVRGLKPQILNPEDYVALLDEYRSICRARACIRSKDAENFSPIVDRLRYLRNELKIHHEQLFRTAEAEYKYRPIERERALESIALLKRGVSIIGEMAELRLPRNHLADAGIYDRDLPEFKGRDASTVGRYTEKVRALEKGKLQGAEVANF